MSTSTSVVLIHFLQYLNVMITHHMFLKQMELLPTRFCIHYWVMKQIKLRLNFSSCLHDISNLQWSQSCIME